MAVQRTKMYATSVVFLLLMATAFGAAGACPGVKWKGGKQTVECRQRGLITLPSNIDPQTQVLDLSGSNFQTLPREAFARANLLNLQKVYLASCRIGRIDETALRGLTNLIELDLSDNLLTDVPGAALRDAPSLRELRLSANPIQKVEARAFAEAPGLAKLDLSDCQIETLAAGAFDGLDQLSHLRLGGNRLEELRPDVVSSLPGRLHGLELHGNPWVCDCRLRHLREWLQQHNVPPGPAAAACHSPPRVTGKALVELQVDDFACPPQVIPPPAPATSPLLGTGSGAGGGGGQGTLLQLHVEAAAGENATLTCRMSGVPAPEITWLWRGRVAVNASGGDDLVDGDVVEGDPAEHPLSGRTVIILEDGKYEKTSRLILSPARVSDSGSDFVCVAANAAGLARLNLTLRVEAPAPTVMGGLGSAQIAGLGVGLFILLAIVIAILLVMLIRTRTGSSGHKQQSTSGASTAAAAGQPGSTTKSPSLSAMEYGSGQFAFVKPTSPGQVVVVRAAAGASASSSPSATTGPDLIYSYQHGNGQTGTDYSSLQRRQHQDSLLVGAAAGTGDYQSAQTDSFYPSALWDHVLPPLSDEDRAVLHASSHHHSSSIGSPMLHLPHVPLSVAEVYNSSNNGQIIANPLDREGTSDGAESVSVDSYSLPCRIPQQPVGYVPYPADYGLPRIPPELQQETASSPPPAPAMAAPPLSAAAHHLNSSGSCYGSKASNSSAESSPASSSPAAKSPRFWRNGNGGGSAPNIHKQTRHHQPFARDSPDEGYQEECATDV